MLTYGFYNSVAGDRVYDAEQLSSIFEGMIHDGVFEDIGDKLVVEASTGMNVKVGTGRAWFNQTWTKNDSDITLAVDAAEVVLNRIDVVVLEVDASVETRANSIKIVKGTPGSSPLPPTLTNTENIHQYPLAYVGVGAGVTSITANYIVNKVGTVDCPFVTGVLRNIDTVAVDAILEAFSDLEQEVEDNRTYYDANIGQTVNKTSIITTTGSANAYVGTYQSYVPISYDGMIAVIKASFSNTGAATINVQTIGVKTIKKMGSGGLVDLATGDIISGGIYALYYDGTYFILGNPLPVPASMFTAAGDIMVASGPNTPARKAKGSALQVLQVNSGGTDLEYADKMTYADFSGSADYVQINSGASLTINVPLGVSAKLAMVTLLGYGNVYFKTHIVGIGSNSNQELMGRDYNSGGYVGAYSNFTFQDSPTTTGIQLSDIYISGTNLVLIFTNHAGGAIYIRASWKGGVIA